MLTTMTSAIRIMQSTSFLEFPRNYQIARITTELSAQRGERKRERESERGGVIKVQITVNFVLQVIHLTINIFK